MRPYLFISAALGLWGFSTQGQTMSVEFSEALSQGEVLPTVQAVRQALQVRETQDAPMGGTLQASQLTLMPGVAHDSSGARGADFQVNFVQGFHLGNLGGARKQAAFDERKALEQHVRLEKLKARLGAARLWLELYTLEKLDALYDEEDTQAQASVESAQKAQAAGLFTATDVAEASASAAEVRQQKVLVEGLRFEAAAKLGQAVGRPIQEATTHVPLATRGPPPKVELPRLEELQKGVNALEALPEVALQRLALQAARSREAEAQAQYLPSMQLGAQVERSASQTWVGYGVATLTMHGFGSSAREVSKAKADIQVAAQQLEQARLEAKTAFLSALHEVEHAAQALQTLETQLVPSLRSLREKRERSLKAGEGTVFHVFDARRRETHAKAELERARGLALWANLQMSLLLSEILPVEGRP